MGMIGLRSYSLLLIPIRWQGILWIYRSMGVWQLYNFKPNRCTHQDLWNTVIMRVGEGKEKSFGCYITILMRIHFVSWYFCGDIYQYIGLNQKSFSDKLMQRYTIEKYSLYLMYHHNPIHRILSNCCQDRKKNPNITKQNKKTGSISAKCNVICNELACISWWYYFFNVILRVFLMFHNHV